MKKTKSISAYTKIWLNRNKHLWWEKYDLDRIKLIELKIDDAPKKVRKGISIINRRRRDTELAFKVSRRMPYDAVKGRSMVIDHNVK